MHEYVCGYDAARTTAIDAQNENGTFLRHPLSLSCIRYPNKDQNQKIASQTRDGSTIAVPRIRTKETLLTTHALEKSSNAQLRIVAVKEN